MMLYVIDFIVIVGCILVLSAGIVWALRSSDYSKNPLHRFYRLLSCTYLKISSFQAAGCDGLKNGKEELCERLFGSRRVFMAADGTVPDSEIMMSKRQVHQQTGMARIRQYRRKILK